MFDANMRYLPKGLKFFCKVHYCSNSELSARGVNKGDILECEMIDDCHDNPRVLFKIKNGELTIKYTGKADDDFFETLCVYEGKLDLSGFICDKSKAVARSIISG